MNNLKTVKNQNDFHELESEHTVILEASIPRGKGGILFLPPFYRDPSRYPNHAGSVRQAQCSNMAQEPVESTLVRRLTERFLGKIGMENAESKKVLETESQTQSKASLQEITPLCHSKISQC